MADFKIEKGIEMPASHRAMRRYPFADMEVGDSFAVPVNDGEDDMTVRSAAWDYGRRHGMKFTGRLLRDEGVLRVWRVA
ncbi:hypothetical protein GRI72_02815 [Altererythrobacter marinus]|uniref:Uncharacterized protein n=1 Tax=Pelagerythrobacter marinus TaxID=538382 RepID=A0ABW9USB8_9SPHN|nr:hypothetical protein [Pelagerythrobacter marinus]MXO67764.1 hypothetical protein [Pelagerythrobacter marinus]